MRNLLYAGILAVAAASPAAAVEQSADQKFAADAATDGMAEVELGSLALKKSDNPQIREFATHLVQDHRKANAELQAIAAKEDLKLPDGGAKLQKLMDTLSGLDGKSFDREFAKAMVEGHEEAVKLFQEYEKDGQNPQLQQFAKQTLAVLEEHLRQAKKLHDAMKSS